MKLLKATILIILITAIFGFKTLWQSGNFKTIENRFNGTTQRIEGLAGVEDLTIDQTTGIAYLSSDDRWARMIHKQKPKGAIYALDLNNPELQPVDLTKNFNQIDFQPHGLSLYVSPEGKKVLFVINHRPSGNYVEIFEVGADSLIHVQSISDPLLISPNDLVGVGERTFYFTNDHNEKVSGWRGFKDVLRIGTGNVCYYDGTKANATTIEGVDYANGINVSADGKTLYLAATTGKSVSIYDRDIASGVLKKVSEIDTNTGVDNIEIDGSGSLWIGCHPKLLKFVTHAKNESALSPSEVIKLTRLEGNTFRQETIYLNDGSEISASSVAAVYKNKLLIGPVFQRHIILGEMK